MGAAIIAAFEEWLTETNEGREYLVTKFGFDWQQGREDCEYDVVEPDGTEATCRGDQIYFLKTCVAKGLFVPMQQVFEREKEKHNCELCNKNLHCTRLVKTRDCDDKVYVCNHCLGFIDQSDIRDEGGGIEECARCPDRGCEYHPSSDRPCLSIVG